MERNVRIKEFFAFLKENRPDESTIDLVIERLALEIQDERSSYNGMDKNEYRKAFWR